MSKLTIFPINTEEKKKLAKALGLAIQRLDVLLKIAKKAKKARQAKEQSFEDIVDSLALAVKSQYKFMADNCGININVKEVEKKYARSIGKFPSRLTKKEQDQAFFNACIEQGMKSHG